jgi:hypothetical protein
LGPTAAVDLSETSTVGAVVSQLDGLVGMLDDAIGQIK